MNTINIYELPPERRQKALEIATKVSSDPRLYTAYNGKRLNYDRNIVSVPLNGGSYRLLFRDLGPTMEFCGAATHAQYDHLISSRNGASIKGMEILAAPPKPPKPEVDVAPKPAPAPQPVAEAPAATPRKKRNHIGANAARAWIRSLKAGTLFSSGDLQHQFNISRTVSRMIIEVAEKCWMVEPTSDKRNHRKYVRTVAGAVVPSVQAVLDVEQRPILTGLLSDPKPAVTPVVQASPLTQAEILARLEYQIEEMIDAVALLKTASKPCTLEQFSHTEILAEFGRRMAGKAS